MVVSIVGLGMSSAVGTRARDHVFYPRAEGPPFAGSPFLLADGRRMDVRRASWLAPLDDAAARMLELARAALDEALTAVPVEARRGIPLYLCLPQARGAVSEEQLAAVERALAHLVDATVVHRSSGSASAFAALAAIGERLGKGGVDAAVLVAADSLISVADAEAALARPPSPFLTRPAMPGEGAAALFAMSAARAAQLGVTPVGRVRASKTAQGKANDGNDEPIDGAMAPVVAAVAGGTVVAAFGQGRVDHLRAMEWEWTVAREHARFDPMYFGACLEADIGRVGDAAGAMNVAHALACVHHRVTHPTGSVLAWAISSDGTRGACSVEGSPGDFVVLGGEAEARRVPVDAFEPPRAPPPAEAEEPVQARPAPKNVQEAEVILNRLGAEHDAQRGRFQAAPVEAAPSLLGDAPLPPVRVDPERAKPAMLADFYDEAVRHFADTAAMLARDRVEQPFRHAAETDARLLRQVDAVVATGGNAVSLIVEWWNERAGDPWATYASVLLLCGFEGGESVEAVLAGCERLADDDVASVVAAAEAMALSRHPGLGPVAARLCDASVVAARAVGIAALSATGALAPELIATMLADPAPIVRRAAIWCCDRVPVEARAQVAPALRTLLAGDAVWPAARQLALLGDPSGLGHLAALGPRAIDMLVLCGKGPDLAEAEGLLARVTPDIPVIAAVGRLGSPRTLEWLLRRLADTELAEAAADALVTMLGPPPGPRLDAAAWRASVGLLRAERYRGGKPWSSVVAAEHVGGDASRFELESACDELRARLDLPPVELWRWHAAAERELTTLLAAARHGG